MKDLAELTGKQLPIFRAMPNTAIAIQQSMTCICHQNATEEQINFIKDIFNQLGKSVTIDEKLMDASTVLGACGTAYAMRYIRANIQGGIEIGLMLQQLHYCCTNSKRCRRIIVATQHTSRAGN